jgi:hypothetical protein
VFSTWFIRLLIDATRELLGEVFSMWSVSILYKDKQLRLRESLETAVRRVGVSCETVAGQ